MPFPGELRGLGTERIKQVAPLSSDKNKLQMGDLIVGYNYQEEAAKEVLLPFTIAHKHTVPAGETLVVHLEVYHLQKKGEKFGKLALTYQIKPEEGFLGLLDEGQDPLQLTLNLETLKKRYTENLRIKTRELPAGDYTLVVTAKDKQTGQKVTRKFAFELREKKEK